MGAETFVVRDAEGNEFQVASSPGGVTVNGEPIRAETIGEGAIRLSGDGAGTAYSATVDDAQWVFLNGEVFRFEIEPAGSRRRRSAAAHGSLTAPMELPVRAPADGTIARVNCREGELVQAGQELVELQP